MADYLCQSLYTSHSPLKPATIVADHDERVFIALNSFARSIISPDRLGMMKRHSSVARRSGEMAPAACEFRSLMTALERVFGDNGLTIDAAHTRMRFSFLVMV